MNINRDISAAVYNCLVDLIYQAAQQGTVILTTVMFSIND